MEDAIEDHFVKEDPTTEPAEALITDPSVIVETEVRLIKLFFL